MKRALLFLLALGASSLARAQYPITITNNTGSQSITCAFSSINLTASSSATGAVTYTWASANATLTGGTVNITVPGNYTVNSSANMNGQPALFSIGINTVSPTTFLSPSSQNITCQNAPTSVSVVANPTINVTHNFLSPYGGTVTAGSALAVYSPTAPGTYTHVLINNVNGCMRTTTFVLNGTGFPTFSITGNQNFVLGCNSNSVVTVMITNVMTQGLATYTVLSPAFFGSYGTSPGAIFSITTPGTWVAIVKDNNSGCESKVPFSVIQNTFGPTVSVAVPAQTLSCDVASVTLQASSTPTNALFTWMSPTMPNVTGTSYTVNTTGVFTSSVIANYTLTVQDNNTTCKNTTVIPMYQNIYPPKAVISGANAITCGTPSITLINSSQTGIPPNTFPTPFTVVGFLWQGAGQPTASNTSTYQAYTPGVYTLTAKDLNNGCTSSTMTTIIDGRSYPVITGNTLVCLDAGQPSVKLSASAQSGPSVTYSWAAPPNANTSGATSGTLTTDAVGVYTVMVTSTTSSCTSMLEYTVSICTGIENSTAANTAIRLFPNPGNGLYTLELKAAGPVTVAIYNLLGELVKKQSVSSGRSEIDLREAPDGVYLVKAGSERVYRLVKH